jgi:isochorismate synthase
MTKDLEHRVCEQVAVATRRARERATPVLASITLPIEPPEDLLAVVEHGGDDGRERFFWERPADALGIAGLGTAAVVSADGVGRFRTVAQACSALLRDAVRDEDSCTLAAPVFAGGFAFSPEDSGEEPWRGFPAGRLVVPCLLMICRGRDATLTLNVLVDRDGDPAELAHRVLADVERVEQAVVSARDNGRGPLPTRYEAAAETPPACWRQAVADTIRDIGTGRLDKLVLARVCTVASDRAFNCGRVVRRLRHAYPSCILFWIGAPHGSFLGATPESLVRVSGRTVSTAAIAGSIAPGTAPDVAQALGRRLMESQKDRREHAFVVQAITEILAPLCARLDVPPTPQLLRLDNVQHLMTPITGRLAERPCILDLVERLHPSSAVAGYPRDAALRILREREGLQRGWYAGSVGWMDAHGDGEFAVAIRSALVRGTHASLYAGAGIVAGSDPDAELAETQLKLQPLLSALMEL